MLCSNANRMIFITVSGNFVLISQNAEKVHVLTVRINGILRLLGWHLHLIVSTNCTLNSNSCLISSQKYMTHQVQHSKESKMYII